MRPQNETREEAAARFQAAFLEHQDERTPHNKNDPEGKKNTHKHLPTRAQLAEWVDALKDETETHFAAGQARHWAKQYLRLEGEDVFWKSSGTKGVPDMKVLCLEDWALRIFDAHVTDKAVHRGRDATYEWLRDPVGGCKKPQEAPAGTVLYKAPMKEVVMDFISGCPLCRAKCGNSKKRKGAPSPTDDDDDDDNNQQDASPRPQKKRATTRRANAASAAPAAPVVPAAPAAPAVPAALDALDAPADLPGSADLAGPAGPADPTDPNDGYQWNDWGLPFPAGENLSVQGNFSYDLDDAAPGPAPALAPGPDPVEGFHLDHRGPYRLIDPALAQVSSYTEPEAAESLQPVEPTLDSAPAPFVLPSDRELGIEVGNAIWDDLIPNQELNFSNEELNSFNLQNANSSNEEFNFSDLQDANSSNEELNFPNPEDVDIDNIDWDNFTF